MSAFSAKNARIQVGGVNLRATKWSVNIKADELDITHYETTVADNTYADYTTGVKEAEISCDILWSSAGGGQPPSFTIGQTVSNLRLYFDRINLAGDYFNFPLALITNVSVDAEVRGVVKFTMTLKNKGVFYLPGGTVA